MKKILVTGGPVHAYLDPVKMVTNRFKGGMMVDLAEELASVCELGPNEVTLLCPKATLSSDADWIGGKVVNHDGFEDYRAKVKELAKDMDAVILGAAVANLIPTGYYKGSPLQLAGMIPTPMPLADKFPSHNYKPGDRIVMEWTIAPRVIDEVKAAMKPGAHLFGFKLLAGQPHEELIRAAYGVLLESHATVVFANDAKALTKKYAVTKERGVHEMALFEMPRFIMGILDDAYYTSVPLSSTQADIRYAWGRVQKLVEKYGSHFVEVEDGMKFGSVAWRVEKENGVGFVTTARGKREGDDLVYVASVKHDARIVIVLSEKPSPKKATLNAPLLARILEKNPKVHGILHFHKQHKELKTQAWAPPGTVRDTERDVSESFNVEGHGSYVYLDENGKAME